VTIFADDSVLQRALDKEMLSLAQLESARTIVSRQPRATSSASAVLGQLVADGVLTAWQVARLRGEQLGIPFVELRAASAEPEAISRVSRELVVRHLLVPLAFSAGVLRIAQLDPLDTAGADELAQRLEVAVEVSLASPKDVAWALARWYPEASVAEPASFAVTDSAEAARADITEPATSADDSADDTPVIKLVQELIEAAVAREASDLHLEPMEKRFRVRHRVDGALVEVAGPPKRLQAAIVSRVKIMANLSIAEKRVPQDGRIQLRRGGRALDLRVSTLPTAHGESVVMRILDQDNVRPGLADLGMTADDTAQFEQLVTMPDGLVLVTGPTGSGKTTTLYGCLAHLNRSDRKVITVEDPVEYQLNGINQVPVRSEFGVTFASALRAILRQAPNVVMIGEIRDREAAEIAVNAALTGHMVFSTLHTNDAVGAIARLADLGVKPFLIAAAVRAVVAQRLVRRICPNCARPHVPTAAEMGAMGWSPGSAEAGGLKRGAGCPACHGTGYRGRVGIFEILVIDEALQQLIHDRAGVSRLRAAASAQGMRSLRADGARKVSAGLTTIEEVVSITASDASPTNLPHPS